jgi:predicted dehydrogenase
MASENLSRRGFLQRTAQAGALGVGVPSILPGSALGANDRIQLGLIGAGPMGRANLAISAKYPDVAVTGICDVWKPNLEAALKPYRATAKSYSDYHEMLGAKNIDAVIVATPPHWHCLITVDACKAGKDVYLQKPMTLSVAEALVVKRAVERHGRVCQVGTQIHAHENYHRVVEMVRSGNLGKISTARTFIRMNHGAEGIGSPPDVDPPKGLDWNQWVGPAAMRPFKECLIGAGEDGAYKKLSFMAYRGGWTTGMAPHILDLPFWALNLGFPSLTMSMGGRHVLRDAGDAPDTHEVLWQFPGLTLTWMMSQVNSYGFDLSKRAGDDGTKWRGGGGSRGVSLKWWLGVYFHGVNGTLYSDYEKHTVVPEGERMKDLAPPAQSIPLSPGHEREWLDCIRSRAKPSCSPGYHYKIDTAIHLANLSLKLGRAIRFDASTEKIVGDAEAARLAKPEYRAPWKFPEEYL